MDRAGRPHVAYVSHAAGVDLHYAFRGPSGWTIRAADDGGERGQHTSMALDPSGRAHVSYFDLTGANLRYATGTTCPEP